VEVDKGGRGLTLCRCKRGSFKTEAGNLVIERMRSTHTTARMLQSTATGSVVNGLGILRGGAGQGEGGGVTEQGQRGRGN
jgi:hypothetical protein